MRGVRGSGLPIEKVPSSYGKILFETALDADPVAADVLAVLLLDAGEPCWDLPLMPPSLARFLPFLLLVGALEDPAAPSPLALELLPFPFGAFLTEWPGRLDAFGA